MSTIAPPPLRNGAPLHAHYYGRREAELAWLGRALTSPLSAISTQRAACTVVDCHPAWLLRAGRLSAILLLARAHGLARSWWPAASAG